MLKKLIRKDNCKISIYEIDFMLQWGTPKDLEIYNKWSKYFNRSKIEQKYIDKYETTTILPLAGRGVRFIKDGYKTPKPLIDINGLPMVIQSIKSLPQSSNNVFICLQEHIDNYSLADKIYESYPNAFIQSISNITEGQAITAKIGINKFNINLDKPILISACDNAVHYNVSKYQSMVDDITNDVIVWSFRNEPTSRNNPEMYGWIDTFDNDTIKYVSCKKFIKGIHDLKRSHIVIGTIFYRKAKYYIDGLNENYKNNIRTNGEFYIDDVINQNVKANLKVKIFEVDHYICWGTPNDYKTYNYWNNYFNK